MAEEENKKTDEFSNFEDLDLDNELNKTSEDPNDDANSEVSKESSELEGFFEDLDQLEKEPEASNEIKNDANQDSANTVVTPPILPKKKLKLPSFNIQFKKILKYGLIAVIIGATALGGYYLFFWVKNFYNDNKDMFVNMLPGNDAIKIPDLMNQIIIEDTKNTNTTGAVKNTSDSDIGYLVPDKDGTWRVQVAACLRQNCIKRMLALLDNNLIPKVLHKTEQKNVTSTFIKLTSLNIYENLAGASRDLNLINKRNSFGLNAYTEKSGNSFRIVFGLFPVETYGINDYIDKVKSEIIDILPQTVFETFYEKNQNSLSKVYLGPFKSRKTAQRLLDSIQTKEGFNQAFLVQN